MAGKNISSSAGRSENSGKDNLYAVGGDLTNTIKPSSMAQLEDVAVNSGLRTGPVDSTNTWGIVNDNDYGVNLDKGSGGSLFDKNPVNDGY